MYIPDKFSKTINIPVHIVNGKIEYFYEDGVTPELKDGSIGELIIPAHALKNDELRKKLSQENKIKFLDKDSKLYIQTSYKDRSKIGKELHTYLESSIKKYGTKEESFFVEIILEEELQLLMRGSKKARLMPCKCSSRVLGEKKAISLNQIYTLISELFEPSRASHSGNVFSKIFYLDGDSFFKIDRLRENKEYDYEKEYLLVKPEDKK